MPNAGLELYNFFKNKKSIWICNDGKRCGMWNDGNDFASEFGIN